MKVALIGAWKRQGFSKENLLHIKDLFDIADSHRTYGWDCWEVYEGVCEFPAVSGGNASVRLSDLLKNLGIMNKFESLKGCISYKYINDDQQESYLKMKRASIEALQEVINTHSQQNPAQVSTAVVRPRSQCLSKPPHLMQQRPASQPLG